MKLGLLLLAAVAACTPSPVVPIPDAAPPADAAQAEAAADSDCAGACAAMARARCSEGVAPNCVSTCVQIAAQGFIALDVACLAGARSPAEVRGCGVACTTPHDS
jgi:hypothetical protein